MAQSDKEDGAGLRDLRNPSLLVKFKDQGASAGAAAVEGLSPEVYKLLWASRDPTAGDKIDPKIAQQVMEAELSRIPSVKDMTRMQRESARISAEQWNRYEDKYIPFEDSAIRDILTSDRYAPAIRAATQAAVFRSQPAITDFGRATRGNVNALVGRTGGSSALGQAVGRGVVAADQNVTDYRTQGMGNLVSVGRGGADRAADAMSTLAGMSAREGISLRDYQLGLESLAQNRSQFESAIDTAERIGSLNTTSKILNTGVGVGMYLADPARGSGGKTAQTTNWWEPGGGMEWMDTWQGAPYAYPDR